MPYRDELHFMYLFLKATLETEFPGLICQRADKQAMAGLLTDKIQRSITSADVIIADCTGVQPERVLRARHSPRAQQRDDPSHGRYGRARPNRRPRL